MHSISVTEAAMRTYELSSPSGRLQHTAMQKKQPEGGCCALYNGHVHALLHDAARVHAKCCRGMLAFRGQHRLREATQTMPNLEVQVVDNVMLQLPVLLPSVDLPQPTYKVSHSAPTPLYDHQRWVQPGAPPQLHTLPWLTSRAYGSSCSMRCSSPNEQAELLPVHYFQGLRAVTLAQPLLRLSSCCACFAMPATMHAIMQMHSQLAAVALTATNTGFIPTPLGLALGTNPKPQP
jgi:hypothetical protein